MTTPRAGLVAAVSAALFACSGPGGPVQPVTTPDGFGTCTPSCHFKQCGDDGCGGSCGTCGAGEVCKQWQCLAEGEEPEPVPDAADVVEDGGGATDGVDATPELPERTGSDQDSDGVDDALDNCPAVYNPNQADLDGDFLGDVCDPDRDGDDSINELDCAPNNPEIHPYAKELCHNAVDDNCNDAIDEEGAWDCTEFFVDADGDGAGDSAQMRCLCDAQAPHSVVIAGDCDDNDPNLSPLTPEICDGVDNNCNLLVDDGCDDDGDGFCDASMAIVGSPAVCPQGGGDCYDYSASVYPGAPEVAGDDVDNDCNGVKEGEPSDGPIDCSCPTSCTGASVADFLCAIDMCCSQLVINQGSSSPTGDPTTGAFGAITQYGNPTNDLAPFQGTSYAALASGYYADKSHQSGDSLPGGNYGIYDPYTKESSSEMNDAIEVYFTLKAPEGATGFSLDYIFMSAEYEEYIGTSFNDKFYMIIEAASTNGGAPTVINYTDCTDPSAWYDTYVDGNPVCYIAINTAFTECCDANNDGACDSASKYPPGFVPPAVRTDISGTGHECTTGSSTGWLTTKWPVNANETFKITFHIHDTADEILDSMVLIDNFKWEGGTFTKGTASHN